MTFSIYQEFGEVPDYCTRIVLESYSESKFLLFDLKYTNSGSAFSPFTYKS